VEVTTSGPDNLEIMAGGSVYVIDYKYSNKAKTKGRTQDENSLQPALYVLAVERFFRLAPAGMQYCSLRGAVNYVGWDAPFDEGWLEGAIARTLDAAERIRAGEIAPQPADGESCGYCESHDVCRYVRAARTMTSEGA
jgi:CRISPR/Cas system-associated exonuclease Cas4 (RecB family)